MEAMEPEELAVELPNCPGCGTVNRPGRRGAVGPISCVKSGGDEGTRTPDPRDANAVLSQLSYIPTGRQV
jgi:hypothetical protein